MCPIRGTWEQGVYDAEIEDQSIVQTQQIVLGGGKQRAVRQPKSTMKKAVDRRGDKSSNLGQQQEATGFSIKALAHR